ncbi:MAG: PEP-CTERM sorting domain-containing protein [Alphaproteobacteria bacterium]|nr:MAG: PEP-CTERM sorting domain-containing protein [Alphaproteobacteria bacterium]
MKALVTILAMTGALAFAAPASAVTLINGSFELSGNPNAGPRGYTEVSPGSLEILGWTVGGAGVDLVGSNYWDASDGIQSVDLSRRGAGSISQSFATVVGVTYLVTFDLSGNPFGGVDDKITVISFSGNDPVEQVYSVSAANSPTNMLWETYGFSFTASALTSTLTFTSAEGNRFGPALDNVAITGDDGAGATIPEPSTWAMLVIGFGLVGVARRRRATAVAA